MAAKLFRFILIYGVLALILGCIHYFFLMKAFGLVEYREYVPSFYGFIFGIHALSYLLLLVLYYKESEHIGFFFLGIGLVKMLASIAFLWEIIHFPKEIATSLVVQFFLVYFIFLFVEARKVFILMKAPRPTKPEKLES